MLKKINKYKLKAIFITNILGHCGDMQKISSICKRKKVILFEDNCESLGTVTNKNYLELMVLCQVHPFMLLTTFQQ